MALFQRIATAADIRLLRVGDTDLVRAHDMSAFLESARRMRVGILRIEAVWVSREVTLSDPSAIADYSDLLADPNFTDRSIGAAAGFLAIAGRADHHYKIQIVGRNPLVE